MKTIAENRRARFDYEILEKFEAGIELNGQEVKSAKNGNFNLSGSYGIVRNSQVWLINSEIPSYQAKNAPADYDSKRSRRLLLKKEEVKSLLGRLNEKSLALIPFSAYLKRSLIKLELALARPRRKIDKRELLKKRTMEREIKKGD